MTCPADDPPAAWPTAPLPVHHCPVCGGPNACATAAAGRFDAVCWCRDLRFPPSLWQQLRARGAVGCVCRACAETALAAERRDDDG